MSVSVGIDLGTTFCAVAYINPTTKLPTIIPNSEGKNLTPSVIQYYDGEFVFGSEAENAYNAGEENCAATFKRAMGSGEDYCYLGGKPYTSEQLSAMLLHHLKEEAEATLNDTIEDAVITVPAYFFSREREATIRAAEAAGLKVKCIIDEPSSAALAYGLNHWRENAKIMVYDLGGGTFDISLLQMGKDGALTTIVTKGNHTLGGRDWDKRVEDILINHFESKTDLSIRNDADLFSIVNGMSEGVKKKLSAMNMNSVDVTAFFPGYGPETVTITRQEFENNSEDLLERTGALCKSVLNEVGLKERDITDILLVGGSTRMPQVSEYLQKMFNKRPLLQVNPDEAVALGAAIKAAIKADTYTDVSLTVVDGKKKTDLSKRGLNLNSLVRTETKLSSVQSLSLKEITAHALGVIAINDEGNRYYNEVIIPANHPRPVRLAKKFLFNTSPDSANELTIYVLQGDSENPMDCEIAYKYVVSGIKHVNSARNSGTLIRIQYSYDANGVIHVQVRQENRNTDLPIRSEPVPRDKSVFGRPITGGNDTFSIAAGQHLGVIGTSQNVVHKYKEITFSNTEWEKYDNLSYHEPAHNFHEPKVHVVANKKKIEFHGYNISAMDEGVRYIINPRNDFEIECDINTSTIKEHPGGHLVISIGPISAHLNQSGGELFMDNNAVGRVPSKFHLKMSLCNGGDYEIAVDKKVIGSTHSDSFDDVEIIFGFVHDSHYCELISHAYVSDIQMHETDNTGGDDNPETDTWDD